MTIDIKATIHAAVDILTREADSLRECHTRERDPDDWNGEEDAKAAYDHELSTAGALADIPAIFDAQAAEIARLRGALKPLAEIDLTKAPPDDFAWFVLRARAVLSGESKC